MKNPIDAIRNRTHNLLACSAVPQQTALLHTPLPSYSVQKKIGMQQQDMGVTRERKWEAMARKWAKEPQQGAIISCI
jgi:hypothetical protein